MPIPIIRFSDVLFETLEYAGIEATRPALQELAIAMRDELGPDAICRHTYDKVKKVADGPVIVEGIRWWPDHDCLRSFEPNTLVSVTAPVEIRYPRRLTQGEKVGEAEMSFEVYEENERIVATEVNIPAIGKRADYTIVNDSTEEALREKVRTFIYYLETKVN
ncbi:MAG: hypothetical protein O2794_02815 [bacterium]|nr:hypothetical protein [bacterium]